VNNIPYAVWTSNVRRLLIMWLQMVSATGIKFMTLSAHRC